MKKIPMNQYRLIFNGKLKFPQTDEDINNVNMDGSSGENSANHVISFNGSSKSGHQAKYTNEAVKKNNQDKFNLQGFLDEEIYD